MFRGAYDDTELSLTVPITNSLAFLFTVLGEWYAEGKVISRGKCHRYPSLGHTLTFEYTRGLA